MKLINGNNFSKNTSWIYSVKNLNELIEVLIVLKSKGFIFNESPAINKDYYKDIIDPDKRYPINIFYNANINLMFYGSKNFGFKTGDKEYILKEHALNVNKTKIISR